MNGVTNVKNLPVYTGVIGLSMTVFRILLAFFCVHFIFSGGSHLLISTLVLTIIVFDYYDGRLFRKSIFNENENWRSFRRILDSCADRISIQVVCIPLLIMNHDFWVPYLAICFKEIMTSTICLKSYFNGYIIYPSTVSRISTILVGLTAISYLLLGYKVSLILSFLLLMGGIWSLFNYLKLISMYKKGMLTEGKGYERV